MMQLQLAEGLRFIAYFLNTQCSPSPSFTAEGRHFLGRVPSAMVDVSRRVKRRLGTAAPGPIAEQLEAMSGLPPNERFNAAAEIIMAWRASGAI
jgi:hypothetical protein